MSIQNKKNNINTGINKKRIKYNHKLFIDTLDALENNNIINKNENIINENIKNNDCKNLTREIPENIKSSIPPFEKPDDKSYLMKINIDDDNICYDKDCNLCAYKAPYETEKINIDVEINNIEDLIKLCDNYKLATNVEYNIDIKSLHNIKNQLIELNDMIGMKSLKSSIVDQLLYYIQKLHIPVVQNKVKKCKKGQGDFLHTVIYGPPGTGKTEIAKIIGNIYANLGILKKNKFKKVTRSDLIAGYLGQTALKTKDVIKDSLGGVLFIDEAYSLGNQEKRDSFSKECIDTLCEALSDHKDNLMVIIAGYEKELKDCFFNYNEGLDSRFTWRFKIDEYNVEEMMAIFTKKVIENGWTIDEPLQKEWFEKNNKYFKYFGRDMETLFAKTKISHSRRVFCKPIDEKTKLIMKDLENGMKLYLENDEVKSRCIDYNKGLPNMYL